MVPTARKTNAAVQMVPWLTLVRRMELINANLATLATLCLVRLVHPTLVLALTEHRLEPVLAATIDRSDAPAVTQDMS